MQQVLVLKDLEYSWLGGKRLKKILKVARDICERSSYLKSLVNRCTGWLRAISKKLESKTSEFHRCCLCHNNACGALLSSGAGVLCSLPRHRLFPVHLWIWPWPGPSRSLLACLWHLLSGQVGQDKTSFFIRSPYYRWTNSTSGKPYASFQGVRYAQPPLGELRCLI